VSPASSWADAYGDVLSATALTGGAIDWSWHSHTWGVVFELCFEDDEAWERYRALMVVQSALEAVPDPLTGLIVYRGRGGSSGSSLPRRPRPMSGSGAASLPLPWEIYDDVFSGVTSLHSAPIAALV
jgi:hypothetical protein